MAGVDVMNALDPTVAEFRERHVVNGALVRAVFPGVVDGTVCRAVVRQKNTVILSPEPIKGQTIPFSARCAAPRRPTAKKPED